MLGSIFDVLSVFTVVAGLVTSQEVRYPVGSNAGVVQGSGQHRNPGAVGDVSSNQGPFYAPPPGEHTGYVPGDHGQGGNAHSHPSYVPGDHGQGDYDPHYPSYAPGEHAQGGNAHSHPSYVPGDHEQGGYDPHYPSYVHNVPPAPEPSASSYIATLSYGEGYPTIVYHCSLTDHKPVATSAVHGPNGHLCTVSYYKTPSYVLAPPQSDAHYHHSSKGPFTTLLDMILPSYEKSAGEGIPVGSLHT